MKSTDQVPSKGTSTFRKFLNWFILIAFLSVSGIVYAKYYFVFGDGVKSGVLNFAVKKGNIFKTYEGKLIQDGIRTPQAGTGLTSNEFEFSIEDQAIYDSLSRNSGKYIELHYKEYHGVLPWRGNTRYIVDEIIAIREASTSRF
ncbi:hypothetical protein ACFRAE_00745 [Sphingobacterium sp. HJSM2_6]|uniref:hypothetical protein n=1 Tax=Sphingobacterium sp. HJSM2_6 TaxID=3366264 RepID=UPI003BD412B2